MDPLTVAVILLAAVIAAARALPAIVLAVTRGCASSLVARLPMLGGWA